jgi:hypothetical protein
MVTPRFPPEGGKGNAVLCPFSICAVEVGGFDPTSYCSFSGHNFGIACILDVLLCSNVPAQSVGRRRWNHVHIYLNIFTIFIYFYAGISCSRLASYSRLATIFPSEPEDFRSREAPHHSFPGSSPPLQLGVSIFFIGGSLVGIVYGQN